jgi:hypothetical protein
MQEPDFVLMFPLYLIVIPSKGCAPLICVSEDDESIRGVAMFTEELFAERTRDVQSPEGVIWKVQNADALETHHIPLFKTWGYKYVAIDPHEETGRGSYVPIEDLER